MKLALDESYPGEFDLNPRELERKLHAAVRRAAGKLGLSKAIGTYQSHTFEPKVGDKIENVNPKCKHNGSQGTVLAVKSLPGGKGSTVKYRCTNSGENWTTGDVLEKTLDQLAPRGARKAGHNGYDLIKAQPRGGEIDVIEDLVAGLSDVYKARLEKLKASIRETIQ